MLGVGAMQRARHCLSLAAVAALTCGLGGHLPADTAYAENGVSTASRIVAVYRVDIGNFNLGEFKLTTTFRGGGYEMRGVGRFKVLEGLIYEWRGVTAIYGRMTNTGPEPTMYAFNYADSAKTGERLRMTFDGRAVADVSISPRNRPLPRTIPVTKQQLEGVLDPMSGAFLSTQSENPNGDLSVCNKTLPVFDGRQRYDLVVSPKRAVTVKRTGGDLRREIHSHRRIPARQPSHQADAAKQRDRGVADPGAGQQYVRALSDCVADAGGLWLGRRDLVPSRDASRQRRAMIARGGSRRRINVESPNPNM